MLTLEHTARGETQLMTYRNVTISGLPGAGSTTLLKLLREKLEPIGWEGYSGGEYMRQFAAIAPDKGHHSALDYPESVDRRVDYYMRQQLFEDKGLIIESWLSGFMAQGIPDTLKVLITCSNDLDRAARLADRDGMDHGEAILHAFNRLKENVGRWSVMYAQEWDEWVIQQGTLPASVSCFFWHPQLYDLVIDTAVYNPQECLQMTLNTLGFGE